MLQSQHELANEALATHDLFSDFHWVKGTDDGWCIRGGLGGRYRKQFLTDNALLRCFEPQLDEELFEWFDVLESVLSADQSFTMIELGCGFARWLVIAALALRQRGQVP